jgi:hypothetical protein
MPLHLRGKSADAAAAVHYLVIYLRPARRGEGEVGSAAVVHALRSEVRKEKGETSRPDTTGRHHPGNRPYCFLISNQQQSNTAHSTQLPAHSTQQVPHLQTPGGRRRGRGRQAARATGGLEPEQPRGLQDRQDGQQPRLPRGSHSYHNQPPGAGCRFLFSRTSHLSSHRRVLVLASAWGGGRMKRLGLIDGPDVVDP